MTEVEAIVNSCTLTSVSDDINDYRAISPNHFVIGRNSPNLPPINCKEININLCSKWKSVQATTNMFWERWIKEYLPTLTDWKKWKVEGTDIKPGDLLILCDKNIKRCSWPLARVLEIIPSRNGRTRIVKIKTKDGIYTRPKHSIALLETCT